MNKIFSLITILFSYFISAQDYSETTIPEELKKNAYVVVRSDNTTININAIDEMEIIVNKTITILNKSGESFSTVYIPYDKGTSIRDVKVSVLDTSGKVMKKYSKSDFTDVRHSQSFSFYDDNRVLYLHYMSNTYPYSLQYTYTTETENTIFLPDFSPVDGYNISTQNTSLTINNKSGIALRTKVSENDFAKLTSLQNGNVYNYSYQNIPAFEDERMSPSLEQFLPKVEFSLDKFNLEGKQGTLANWQEFGSWFYQNLIVPSSQITPELRAEVAMLNLSGTTSEKVKKLYQYMQSKTRYIAIAEGIGGWKPMLAEDVRSKGYGDCKALTNYMRTLLSIAGIKSYYSRIKDGKSIQRYDEDFPKMGGNHIILMIPTEKDTIWLENTSQNIAYNHLNYTSLDRNVMCLSDNEVKLVNTPSYKPEHSKELINATVKINLDNSIEVDSKFKFSGSQYDFQLPITSLKQDEVIETMKERYDNLKFENLAVENITNNRDDALVNYDLKFKAKDYSKKLGEDIFFRAMPFIEAIPFSSSEERRLPLELPYSFQDEYKVEFQIPIGYKLAEVPKSIGFSSEFGDYAMTFSAVDGKLFVNRTIVIKKQIYPKEKYQDYLNFRKKTTNLDNTKILITKI